jgi:DNA-binding CsgD family transcriptional regulator
MTHHRQNYPFRRAPSSVHTEPMQPSDIPVLLEVASETGTARLPARQNPLRIGRAVDNDVVLDSEPTVSRYHAELLCDADGWCVRDLGSQNGTHVNGVRLGDGSVHRLAGSDVIGIGAVTIRLLDASGVGASTIIDDRGKNSHKLMTALSNREREVLTLVAGGRTDDQVANELFISVKTVHSHLDKIRDKSGVRRRADLTRLAVRLGLSTPPR